MEKFIFLICILLGILWVISMVVGTIRNRKAKRLLQAKKRVLSNAKRNQLALDNYINSHKSSAEIGLFYERFLGYQYESKRWKVHYNGALQGYEDRGRDLICTKGKQVHIVQAKCWAAGKTIHEKHIFQLSGSSLCYEMEHNLPQGSVTPVFATTANLSTVAKDAALRLGVIVKNIPLERNYPMIKCHIHQGKKRYFLPFDPHYDHIQIQAKGECYVLTALEAEKKGFRRGRKQATEK